MIIRSQNKHNIETFCNAFVDLGCFTVYVNGLPFGEYSTEEKAIRVLDMIQNAYVGGVQMVISRDGEVSCHSMPIIFQMPSDEEV